VCLCICCHFCAYVKHCQTKERTWKNRKPDRFESTHSQTPMPESLILQAHPRTKESQSAWALLADDVCQQNQKPVTAGRLPCCSGGDLLTGLVEGKIYIPETMVFPIKCRGLILQFFPWTNPVIYCSISVLGGLCHMKCTDWNRWNNIIYGNN
jgi:hypothetical protein